MEEKRRKENGGFRAPIALKDVSSPTNGPVG
jgi:hypothetical protein